MKILPLLLAAVLTVAAQAKEPLRIEGSNTFGEKLGPLLVSGFKSEYPGTAVTLKRPGSGAGLEAHLAGRADVAGKWSAPGFEPVRVAVAEKNTLWFRYTRPTNWAFLAGDRTEQPSSRDHRDLKVRWFPSELEQFVPLIAEAEHRIEKLAPMTPDSSR